jgi:hypothetical protein
MAACRAQSENFRQFRGRLPCWDGDFIGLSLIGEMPNDLPMLRWSGSGIAVANAHPEVLAAADAVTRSNDADGVALVLERLGYADLNGAMRQRAARGRSHGRD